MPRARVDPALSLRLFGHGRPARTKTMAIGKGEAICVSMVTCSAGRHRHLEEVHLRGLADAPQGSRLLPRLTKAGTANCR